MALSGGKRQAHLPAKQAAEVEAARRKDAAAHKRWRAKAAAYLL